MEKDFEVLGHTADFRLRAYGDDLRELFSHALVGMFQAIVPQSQFCHLEAGRVMCTSMPISREIKITSYDRETLLVDFLAEALCLSDIHGEAYLGVSIYDLDERHIKAKLHGIPVTGFEEGEIKAATHHGLKIEPWGDGFMAEIVFDL